MGRPRPRGTAPARRIGGGLGRSRRAEQRRLRRHEHRAHRGRRDPHCGRHESGRRALHLGRRPGRARAAAPGRLPATLRPSCRRPARGLLPPGRAGAGAAPPATSVGTDDRRVAPDVDRVARRRWRHRLDRGGRGHARPGGDRPRGGRSHRPARPGRGSDSRRRRAHRDPALGRARGGAGRRQRPRDSRLGASTARARRLRARRLDRRRPAPRGAQGRASSSQSWASSD